MLEKKADINEDSKKLHVRYVFLYSVDIFISLNAFVKVYQLIEARDTANSWENWRHYKI